MRQNRARGSRGLTSVHHSALPRTRCHADRRRKRSWYRGPLKRGRAAMAFSAADQAPPSRVQAVPPAARRLRSLWLDLSPDIARTDHALRGTGETGIAPALGHCRVVCRREREVTAVAARRVHVLLSGRFCEPNLYLLPADLDVRHPGAELVAIIRKTGGKGRDDCACAPDEPRRPPREHPSDSCARWPGCVAGGSPPFDLAMISRKRSTQSVLPLWRREHAHADCCYVERLCAAVTGAADCVSDTRRRHGHSVARHRSLARPSAGSSRSHRACPHLSRRGGAT
jgi:hypothetical protein